MVLHREKSKHCKKDSDDVDPFSASMAQCYYSQHMVLCSWNGRFTQCHFQSQVQGLKDPIRVVCNTRIASNPKYWHHLGCHLPII